MLGQLPSHTLVLAVAVCTLEVRREDCHGGSATGGGGEGEFDKSGCCDGASAHGALAGDAGWNGRLL